MRTLFDELKEIIKEEFGYTLEKSSKQNHLSFETLYGIDLLEINEADNMANTFIAESFSFIDDEYIGSSLNDKKFNFSIEEISHYKNTVNFSVAA